MIDFREMPYARPDMEAMKRCIEQATTVMQNAKSYEEALALAAESVDSGRASEKLNSLVEASNRR